MLILPLEEKRFMHYTYVNKIPRMVIFFLHEKIGVVIGNGTVSHKVGSVSSDVDNSPSIKPPSSPRPILVRCNSKNQKRRTGTFLS